MPHDTIRLLIVEDSQEYATMLRTVLTAEPAVTFEITHAENFKQAQRSLEKGHLDIVLLDLSLPDSIGLDTFLSLQERNPEIPIVLITAMEDEDVALRAVRKGAQDYLVKGELDINQLVRSLRYAVERQKKLVTFEERALVDELTGLYNRRGFLLLAEKQLKLSQRNRSSLLLVYADLDNLKRINDVYGHPVGDQAIKEAAEILRETFRGTDIISRIGGDEFAVLAIDVGESFRDAIDLRMSGNVSKHQQRPARSFDLALSWGIAVYSPGQTCTIEELLERADIAMFSRKKHKKDQKG